MGYPQCRLWFLEGEPWHASLAICTTGWPNCSQRSRESLPINSCCPLFRGACCKNWLNAARCSGFGVGCIAGRFRIVDCGYAVWICWSVGWSCRAWARLRNCTDSTQSDRTRSTFCSQNIPGCVINAAYACIGAPERRCTDGRPPRDGSCLDGNRGVPGAFSSPGVGDLGRSIAQWALPPLRFGKHGPPAGW